MHTPTILTAALAATLSSASVIQANAGSDLPANCNAVYRVQNGDNCSKYQIGSRFSNFTYTQLYEWNPSIGQDCFLYADTPLCVGTPDYVFQPPMQAAPNTIVPQSALPVPIKSGSMKDCKLWYFVGAGLTGDEMSQKAGVSKEDLMKWNPILQRNDGGWNEMGLMAEYFYCVGV